MDVLAERLDTKLREWEPNTVGEVRARVTEIIGLADHGVGYNAIAFRRTGGFESVRCP